MKEINNKEAEIRISALETRVNHLTQEMDTMVREYEKSQKLLQSLINQYSEPEIDDDSWYSIAGIPEEMRGAAEVIVNGFKENK